MNPPDSDLAQRLLSSSVQLVSPPQNRWSKTPSRHVDFSLRLGVCFLILKIGFGGDTRVRTEDLQHAMLTLYQLSYVPHDLSSTSI